MKKLILSLAFLLLLSCWLQAQSGKVIYEHRINLHKRLSEENAQMKAMLPEWQEWKTQLIFQDTRSIYRNYEDEETDATINASSGGMQIRLQRPESITFQDLSKKERVTQEEFMQKRYLITEPLPAVSWKITGESREILGYHCQQAILQEETGAAEAPREVVAWFTAAISLPAGPSIYGQLPGLILVIDIDNGTSTIEAKKVDLGAGISANELEAPTKGKAMSREAFQKEQEKIMEQMNQGGGRGMRIRF